MSENDDLTRDTTRHEPIDALDSHPGDTPGTGGRRGLVTAVVVALALLAAGGAGAALARGGSSGDQAMLAASTGSASASPNAKTPKLLKHKALKRFGGPGLMGFGGALHGTFVVPNGSGGYTTVVMQHGKASKVSDSSITVTSADGFAQTYVINAKTGVGADRQGTAGIDNGADVVVTGTQKGDVVTATHLVDVAAFRDRGPGAMGGFGGPGRGPGAPGGPGHNDVQPTPSTSGSNQGTSYGV
jgi:hypothetical protein